jgi:hypothetical protein
MPEARSAELKIRLKSTDVRAPRRTRPRSHEAGSRRRLAEHLLVPMVYVALALAVAGPLLGSGLVLAVDLSQAPHPGIPTAYWGLPEGTHEGPPARLPLDALFAALGLIGAVAIGQKVMLLAIVFLAGIGMHRLAPVRSQAAALFAGFLYAANPFVYDRLYTGQWFLLLGYALLPHAYRAFLQTLEGRPGAAWVFGALFVAVGVASTHFAALLLVVCMITLAAWAGRIRRRPELGRSALLALALGLFPSLYWLIPTPGLLDFWGHIGPDQLDLYRTVADENWGLAPTVAGLYGYWNNAAPIKAYLEAWPLLALTLFALAAWGVALRRRDATTWAVAAIGVFGFVLALGDASSLTRGCFTYLLDHVSFLRSFREPQKGVALLAFAYAFLGAAAVEDLIAHPPRLRWAPHAVAVLLVALPLVYGYRTFGGLWGALDTSRFPHAWEKANDRLKREAPASRTLFLPWHGYFALGFAQHRVVANPAPSFFDTPILASRSVGEGSGDTDQSDPEQRYVTDLLARGSHAPNLAACLAPLGVTHILLAKEADWEQYRFLDRGPDFTAVERHADLVLYRSRAPAGAVMTGARSSSCSDRLRPLAVNRPSPVTYRLAAAPPRGSSIVLGVPQASRWMMHGRELRYEPWGTYRRNYLIGLAGLAAFGLSGWLVFRRRAKTPT